MMTIEHIAEICHEANRVYCAAIQGRYPSCWGDLPEWKKSITVDGVKFYFANPAATPEESHQIWLRKVQSQGWKYGLEIDAEKKEHPCMVPYHELSIEQQRKDALFIEIIRAVCRAIPETEALQ